VAIALLLGGGLAAMQTASVSTGILFLLILFVICYSLIVDLKKDLSAVKKES
jgi:choline-glycine betaine transporter